MSEQRIWKCDRCATRITIDKPEGGGRAELEAMTPSLWVRVEITTYGGLTRNQKPKVKHFCPSCFGPAMRQTADEFERAGGDADDRRD